MFPSLPIESRFLGPEGLAQTNVRQVAGWFRIGSTASGVFSELAFGDSLTISLIEKAIGAYHGRLQKWLKKRDGHRVLILGVYLAGSLERTSVESSFRDAVKGLAPDISFSSGGSELIRIALLEKAEDTKARQWLTRNIEAVQACTMKPASEPKTQRQPSSIAEIQDLVNAAVHIPQESEVERLRNLIQYHQENIPESGEEKYRLVDLVNTWLSASGYRIRLPSGKLARLCVRPGGSGRPTILFEVIGAGPAGGFQETPIELVPYKRGDAARILRGGGKERS